MNQKSASINSHISRIEYEIKNGEFGLPGGRFLQTRELAQKYNISLVTAQKVMVALREVGLIELVGKKYYLTYGRIPKRSPLGKVKKDTRSIIGFHVTNIESTFFGLLVQEAGKRANALGYRLITASSNYRAKEEMAILNMFREIGVAGVLSSPGIFDDTAKLYSNYILPHVFLGRKLEGINCDSVLVNNYTAGRNVARHFVGIGYRNFAYIGPKELSEDKNPRFLGFNESLMCDGYNLPKENIFEVGVEDITVVSRIISNFLQNQKEPIAIFCFHDLIAVELLKVCQRLKLKVPENVAICGFDNLPISQITALTTVGYRISEMAQTAVNLLVKQIESGEEGGTNYYVEPTLIVRDTTQKGAVYQKNKTINHDVFYKCIM